MTLSSELRLEIVWFDSDLLELELTVVGCGFSGRANFYAALDELKTFAQRIEGFPHSAQDVREYEFGNSTLPGYGGAKIRLSCRDGCGHLTLLAAVHMNPCGTDDVGQSASVRLNAVPAEIDRFVAELRGIPMEVGKTAVLKSFV